MSNAKNEFIKTIENRKLVCAKIGIDKDGSGIRWFILKNNYSKDDLNDFCEKLNFEYDSGYGGQELFGIILFEDSFSDRGEYDGSEWWENHRIPTIEQVLDFKQLR